jgi:hypothetical protein
MVRSFPSNPSPDSGGKDVLGFAIVAPCLTNERDSEEEQNLTLTHGHSHPFN